MELNADVRKSKKTVALILIFTGILAIASAITAYYYFQISDIGPQNSNASEGCSCYFAVANESVQSCSTATPDMAYEFRAGVIGTNNACSATCDPNSSSKLVTEGSTILSCKVNTFPLNPGCTDLSIEDASGKRYANSVPSNVVLNLKAKFTTPTNSPTPDQDFYSNFSFITNGAKTDIQKSSAVTTGTGLDKQYEISTQLKDLGSSDSLTIQALGYGALGSDITSDACHRVITVSKPQTSSCTVLNAEIINDASGKPKVNEITINTTAISSPKTVTIKFTVGSSSKTLTTKNVVGLITNNALVLNKAYLYKATNFSEGQSFSVLDNEKSSIAIKAQMYVDGASITSQGCSGSFDIPVITEDPRTPVDTTDPDTTPADVQTSNFTVRKTASKACVERVSPANTIRYTITINNVDTNTEGIVRVEDKLPLGFTYQNGTTYVNGALSADSGLVSVKTVGSSQQITFNPATDWSLDSNESLTIRFQAKVSISALSGSNLNEVVVVPVNTPLHSSSLRTSSNVTVAQSCSAPETGLFDSTLSKVILSMFIIFLGTFLYFSQSGLLLSEKLLSSGPIQSYKFWKLKNDNPKKYFEEKFLKDLDKEKKN